jgi:hypothetical protein
VYLREPVERWSRAGLEEKRGYTTEPAVIAVFSFLAGYSERFIIGALERLSQSAVKEKS